MPYAITHHDLFAVHCAFTGRLDPGTAHPVQTAASLDPASAAKVKALLLAAEEFLGAAA
jgi:hypothetical protein